MSHGDPGYLLASVAVINYLMGKGFVWFPFPGYDLSVQGDKVQEHEASRSSPSQGQRDESACVLVFS